MTKREGLYIKMYCVHLQDRKHSFFEAEITSFAEIFNGVPFHQDDLTSQCRQDLVHNVTSSVRKSCLGLRNNELLMCFSNQNVSMKFTVFGDHSITKAAVHQKFTVDMIFFFRVSSLN